MDRPRVHPNVARPQVRFSRWLLTRCQLASIILAVLVGHDVR
jgi:hypothetical protein